uniref:Putative secreted protein n=1 Tax=Lutzomyia longipalpis TaxID=7200 RepID=A0A1B0CIX1_LUTLO
MRLEVKSMVILRLLKVLQILHHTWSTMMSSWDEFCAPGQDLLMWRKQILKEFKKEDKKTHESVPIASSSTQAGPSTISPRKRTRSMFDNNNQPESKDSRALEMFHLHESHQSPPRKRTRSNTKGTVEPRRRSQRLAVQHCSTIAEEEEKVTPISIVDKDSATDDHQGNNYEAYSESVIQPTSSTPIVNSVFTDGPSKSKTFSDANQNETSIDLPKLALRKRANAVSHETFDDCDSFASEEIASDTQILEESSAENNMRCSQSKSQQFSNEELPTIVEDPNEDENVEREAIIEKELDFESFSEDQGDQGDCKPPDESNSASNVDDPEESVDTSTTSTATLHSIRSANAPESPSNNERVNSLKRPRTKRRRLVHSGNSSDSYETDNSKDESFEISSTERILRTRSNKTKKNQRRRSQRLLKSQSPIREETEDQTINNSSHLIENGETGTEENTSFSNSFETTSNSTTTLNSTCVRMTPDNDGRQ